MLCKDYKKINIERLDNQIIMSLVPMGTKWEIVPISTFYTAVETTEESSIKMYYLVIFLNDAPDCGQSRNTLSFT